MRCSCGFERSLDINVSMRFLISFMLLLLTFESAFSGYWGRVNNIKELEQSSKREIDYRIVSYFRKNTPLVFAIHGGNIESGTSKLAKAISGNKWSLYSFEGITAPDYDWSQLQSGYMHLTSHKFNEPLALEMAKQSKDCLSVHGYPNTKDEADICIGGKNNFKRSKLYRILSKKFPKLTVCKLCCKPYLGVHKFNIVNRCQKPGVQVELSPKVRRKILTSDEFTRTLSRAFRQLF